MPKTHAFRKSACYGIKLGIPIEDLILQDQQNFKFCLWLISVLYNISYLLCKMSITIQYLALFQTTSVIVTRICQALLIIILLFGLWAIIGSTFACIPINHFWHEGKSGSCLDLSKLYYSIMIPSLITDLAIFATPLPSISKLKIQRRQKIALIFAFVLGFL